MAQRAGRTAGRDRPRRGRPCRRAARRRPFPPRRRVDSEALDALGRLDEITRRLRHECPWDRSRTSARSSHIRLRRPTSWPTRRAAATTRSWWTSSATCYSRSTSSRCCSRSVVAGSLAEVAEGIVAEARFAGIPMSSGRPKISRRARCSRNWDRIKREEEGRGAGEPFADPALGARWPVAGSAILGLGLHARRPQADWARRWTLRA